MKQHGTISAFTADNTTGVLTPVSGSPYAAGTSVGGQEVSLTFTSREIILYAADPHRATEFAQHDFGGQCAGPHAFHAGQEAESRVPVSLAHRAPGAEHGWAQA